MRSSGWNIEADQITHEVVTRLDRVFITPLDREDIHLLASRLDDVVDLIDGAAHRVQMYHAGEAPQGAILLADVVHRATKGCWWRCRPWKRTRTRTSWTPARR